MQRRKFIAGVGSLAAGAAAVTGTGAFTSVSAERSVSIAVADDSNSFLRLNAMDSRAEENSGELELIFDNSSEGAGGLNPNSRTTFTDLFQIQNLGDNPVYIGVGTEENDVYIDPSTQSGSQAHVADYSNLSTFAYAEEDAGGTGLSFNGGNGNMGIDNGGRVDVRFNSNGSPTPADNPRILTAGESLNVDLDFIVDGTSLGSGGGDRITVAAAEPGSDRDFTDNPGDYGNP